MKLEEIHNDPMFQKALMDNPTLSEATIRNYSVGIMHLCNANNIPFHQLVKTCFKEQRAKIVGNEIIPYDPDYGSISDYQYNMIVYLRNKNLQESSIEAHTINARTVLSALKIQLPKRYKFNKEKKPLYPLAKSDIKYVTSLCGLDYSNMIELQADIGFRIEDIVALKVKDLMKSTYDYHETEDVTEFLITAPPDMIPYWEIIPHKTKRYQLECKVPNPPWMTNKLMRMLHERVKYLEAKGLKLEKEDPLFGNRLKNFKEPLYPVTVFNRYKQLDKKLMLERKRVLNQKLENEEISESKYQRLLKEAPRFHSHGLRKYFINTLAKNHVYIRASALMEGHAPPLNQDDVYVALSKESIMKEYERCLDDFNFDEAIVDFTIIRKNELLEQENQRLQEENMMIKNNIQEEVAKQVKEVWVKSWFKTQENMNK